MKKINSPDEYREAVARHFGRGSVTNCFLSPETVEAEIAAGTLEADETDEALLLCRGREGFRILNFYLRGNALPPIPCGTVLEIPMRERDEGLHAAAETFREAGFSDLFRRNRLIRRPGGECRPCPEVFPAAEEDLAAAETIFRTCFDPETGCLPRRLSAELPHLLVYRVEGEAVGLLHFAPAKNGSELRHLAVLPSFRGQGIAGRLTESYLALLPGRSTVWVRDGNLPAEAVYRRFGYLPDGMTSAVMKKEPSEGERRCGSNSNII